MNCLSLEIVDCDSDTSNDPGRNRKQSFKMSCVTCCFSCDEAYVIDKLNLLELLHDENMIDIQLQMNSVNELILCRLYHSNKNLNELLQNEFTGFCELKWKFCGSNRLFSFNFSFALKLLPFTRQSILKRFLLTVHIEYKLGHCTQVHAIKW